MLKTKLPLALFASLALAGPVAAEAPDPAAVQAGTYNVDPNHSQAVFKLSHFGFTNFTGIFAGATGTLKLDPKNPASSSFSISVPVKTVMTTNATLDGELKSGGMDRCRKISRRDVRVEEDHGHRQGYGQRRG